MTTVKANCILLDVRGRYYYAEEFGKFIELVEWEYEQILNNPYLYYFSTALKKHAAWCVARDEGATLTFLEALGYRGDGLGDQEKAKEKVSPPKTTGSTKRKFVGLFQTRINSNKIIIFLAVAALAAFVVKYNARRATLSPRVLVPDRRPGNIAVAQAPDIQRAIPVQPEIRKAIVVQPEIRRAIPVETLTTELQKTHGQDDEQWCHKEIQLHKWDHYTTDGKTFMIGVFKERHLGDRRLEVDTIAKQIRARFYRIWEQHKLGNVEEVKVVFYK